MKFYNKNLNNKSNLLNLNFFYNYNLKYGNICFYDTLINIYKYKNLYKVSFILNKVSKSLNNYLNIFNATKLI